MIAASLTLGAMSANAEPRDLAALEKFGGNLGLTFQVVDDILDITQTSQHLGKSAGKDVTAGKTTYPSVLGLEKSRLEASRLTRQAISDLAPLGERGDALRQIAEKLLARTM